MCGIVGYIGNKKIVPLLINSLKRLEYRGYDSAGIGVLSDGKLNIIKTKGKVFNLAKKLKLNKIDGNVGIAQTRWATHGEPNEINAHPHLDYKKEIAIVHNGIIENYHTLKKLLEKEGHKIISDTDSEIIAHLIEKFHSGNIKTATIKALKLIEGTFGLAVMHKNEEKIIVARRGSPLIIGIGNEEMFVVSDISAILNQTRRAVYLQDNEIATVTKDNYFIENLEGKQVDEKVYEIKWTVDQIEKGQFKHFMLKEIFEQPEAIENTLRGRIKNKKIKLSLNLDINLINRIIIIACGTSWHSALIGKHIIEKNTGISVEVDYASEFRYRNPIIKKK